MTPTHDCPGGCGAQVARHRYACRDCWYRLPVAFRKPITDNYRRDVGAHMAAMLAAAQWYEDNPIGGAA